MVRTGNAFAAETTNDQQKREIWLRLAGMWTSAAVQCRHGESGEAADAGQQIPTVPPPELAATGQMACPLSFSCPWVVEPDALFGLAPTSREHASSNLNANIPKNMPDDCAAAFASPVVGSFRAGGPIVLNFFEDRRSTRIVRYYRKRRRLRNCLETEARMAA
jgi:hypothetical protein